MLYDSGNSNPGLCINLEGWDGEGGVMGREVGGRFKREGTYVYLCLIHVDVWQKPTQFCKAFIPQILHIYIYIYIYLKKEEMPYEREREVFWLPNLIQSYRPSKNYVSLIWINRSYKNSVIKSCPLIAYYEFFSGLWVNSKYIAGFVSCYSFLV